MATVKRFEDILAWQKARKLVREMYGALGDCKDRGYNDQIQRASVSVLSNIAEGFESGTKQGFLNYLYIAKGSAGEVRAQLYVRLDVGYLNVETFKSLKARAEECSKLLSVFIKGVKQSGVSGLQYKQEKKKDPNEEFIRQQDPELHKKLYANR